MKRYSARVMLEGACFDAMKMLSGGDTKGAFKVLEHKLKEIKQYDNTDYTSVDWS
jgi:hypothetical protein